jgi:hypothetical protein
MSWIKQKLAIIYRKIGVAILNYHGRRQLEKRGYLRLFDARPPNAKPPMQPMDIRAFCIPWTRMPIGVR